MEAPALPGSPRFRRRLTLGFVLVGAATGAVLVAASMLMISTYRHRSFERTARREAELGLLPGPVRFTTPQRLDDLVHEYRRRGGAETVVVTPASVASSSPDLSIGSLPHGFADRVTPGGLEEAETSAGGRPYLILGGTPSEGIKVFFFFPLSDLRRGVRDFAAVLLFGWAVAVVASAAFGNIVARRTLRPVREAAAASQALAEGLLDTRLAHSEDEFGQWADAFNRMAGALAAKIQALSESQERERRFTSDVAHELRTPLSAMVSAAGMLGEELDSLPASSRRAAALLVKDVSRLSELVQELLELARLDAGQESVHFERLRVADALAAVCRTWSADDQPITVDVDPGLEITADRTRFRRVVSNLISNAVRHGGGDVTICAGRVGDDVTIDVADRGPGIPPESLDRIFGRFYKEDSARSAAGSGLGLAIALEQARAQHGTIRVANRPGGGACFTFVVPAAAPLEVDDREGDGAWGDRRASDRAATAAMPPAVGRT
ncbi:MAG: HAMP domain-containing histidine kinase [Actinobacteria bacterium]|nr:HAMP domain-containing histidine kinase [Actinomycetota bacterium]